MAHGALDMLVSGSVHVSSVTDHSVIGHQFGHWAGQLGDGRAISLCKSCSAPSFGLTSHSGDDIRAGWQAGDSAQG